MKTDIFDEIAECIRNEGAGFNGSVYVSRENLASFQKPIAPVKTIRYPEIPPVSAPAPSISKMVPPHPEAFAKTDSFVQTNAGPLETRKLPEVGGMDFAQLEQTVRTCRACRLCEKRTHTVFSDGNEHAELMFIGEGPGEDEDLQGIPFVGKAGQLLTKMIQAMRFERNEVYIANIVKCRPPGNRNPQDDEADCCLPYLRRQIELVHPKVIVTLGAVPLKYLLNITGITRMRGNWLKYGDIPVMPTLHPAYLLRNPSAKAGAWSDLQQVMKVFGKVPAGRTGRETNHGA